MKSATYKTWHGGRNIIGASQAFRKRATEGVTLMFNLPESFINGAAFIKRNVAQFQSDCAEMAAVPAVHGTVKLQLVAASKAKAGMANTGLNESGWRPFAEILGMVSPKSTKLIIPSGIDPTQYKQENMVTWLLHGVYSSSRVDGKGGSRAIKDDVELFAKGLLKKGSKVVREVPELAEAQIELEL